MHIKKQKTINIQGNDSQKSLLYRSDNSIHYKTLILITQSIFLFDFYKLISKLNMCFSLLD